MELYVVRDIPDLTIWGLELASNGANSTGSPSFTFPSGTAAEGDFIYVATETPNFNAFFGFDPNFTNIVLNVNGNDGCTSPTWPSTSSGKQVRMGRDSPGRTQILGGTEGRWSRVAQALKWPTGHFRA